MQTIFQPDVNRTKINNSCHENEHQLSLRFIVKKRTHQLVAGLSEDDLLRYY